jgi:two-component system NarL family sensor kinase
MEIRAQSRLPYPSLLDELGLESALRSYIEGFSERSKIKVELELASHLGRLSTELETAIFRIMQECLTSRGPGRWPGQNWKGTSVP